MKILYVHHNPDTGGASNSLIILLRELKLKGVDVHVATPRGPVVDRFKEVTSNIHFIDIPSQIAAVYGVSFPILRSFRSTYRSNSNRQLKEIVGEVKPDLVHLNEVGLISSAKCIKKLGIKVVLHVRVAVNPSHKIIYAFAVRYINKYVDHVICIDKSAATTLKIQVKKTIIYNPLIAINKKYRPRGKTETLTILFLSNFLVHKGIYDVMKVAEELIEHQDISFLIAGSNVKSKEFYRSLVGRLVNFLKIYPNIEKDVHALKEEKKLQNVRFLGQVKNTKKYLKMTDVLLLPIRMNQPSRSIFEAGSFGIPSIISLKTKIEDVVEDGVNGYIVSENAPSDIAKVILKLNENRDLLEKMGKISFNKFNDLNNPERSATSVINVYKSLI
ncbi:MAG: glycosyltransferase involved in cell wall biosynthesis [Planctomycetota bacterium]|jgi:glycosyltransferase involved in cell wall biosynthesis